MTRIQSLLIILFFSCSNREPINPLDLNNPDTQGKPVGVKLIPLQKSIQISWDKVEVNDINHYTIQRMSDEEQLKEIANVESNSYIDTSIDYFVQYSYRIQVHTNSYSSPFSDFETISIGPYNIYITDFWDSSIKILSWDGNYTFASYPIYAPRDMCLRKFDNKFCIADYYDKRLKFLDAGFTNIESLQLPDYPLDIDINQERGIIFVATKGGLVIEVDRNNNIVQTKNLNTALSWDTRLSFDPKNNYCWITVPDSNKVLQYSTEQNIESIKTYDGFTYPSKIQTFKNAWISDTTGLYEIDVLGEKKNVIDNMKITDIAIDTLNNKCYFSGYSNHDKSWQVGILDMINYEKTIILDGDIPYVYNVYPVISEKQKGTFFIQQAYTWKLFVYNAQKDVIGENMGFNSRISFETY
mgnify:FL=1|tara:strand:- start:1551 stop:2786 length:1236 start_codon:yes stop_codon:yes gene_type:complete